jgi:hypothetical protein
MKRNFKVLINNSTNISKTHNHLSPQIRVIKKLPNTEQSSKGKGKTHKSTKIQNQSTTGKLGKPHLIGHKKTTTYGVANIGIDLGKAQQSGGVKMAIFMLLLLLDNKCGHRNVLSKRQVWMSIFHIINFKKKSCTQGSWIFFNKKLILDYYCCIKSGPVFLFQIFNIWLSLQYFDFELPDEGFPETCRVH